jgi:hypothetical protein
MIVIDEIFALFAVPWLPWLMAVGIVVLGLFLWQRFTARLEPLRRALRRAIELVEHGEGVASFKQRFPAIFEGLAQDPVLGGPWRAYAQTLTPVPGNEQALGAPRAPASVFDDHLFARVGLNLRFYQAVPNILVGLGLLFTFMGLVAALHFASAGVTATDVREAQAALRELLAAATFKFVTSIAGLAASIVFSWREKVQLHAVQALIRKLCLVLEERLVPLTPEALMVTQIEETRRINQKLGQLGRSLIVRAPEGIEARLADELTLATRPLKTALERVARRFETLDERVAGDLVAASQTVRELTGRASALAEAALAVPRPTESPSPGSANTATAAGTAAEELAEASPTPAASARHDAGAAALTGDRRPRKPVGGTAPLTAGPIGSPLRLLQHRLAELSVAVQTGLDRLRGRPPIDRAGIEVVLVTTHDRVREARHALNTVATALLAAVESADDDAQMRAVLSEIDAGLKQSRSALQEAVERLGADRRER